MQKSTLSLENYQSLFVEEKDGKLTPFLISSVYLGNENSPSLELILSLEDILNEFIETNSIPSNPPTLKPEYFKQISEGLDSISKAVECARERLNSLKYVK